MILNSGRHTQPDPQSCRVRSLGGRRGEPKNKQRIKRPKQNWAVRRPIVTKRSTANANTEKSIPPAILTHAMLRKPATTTPKQFQTTWCLAKIGNMQAGLETFNQQPCSPAFFAKKVTAAISFSGRKHIGFLDSKKWSSPVALKACCLNKTQLWFTCVM